MPAIRLSKVVVAAVLGTSIAGLAGLSPAAGAQAGAQTAPPTPPATAAARPAATRAPVPPRSRAATEKPTAAQARVTARPAALPPLQDATTVLSEDFEAGAPGWTPNGFWHVQDHPEAISVGSPAINPTLVTLPDDGHLPAAVSGSHVAWFGEASTGTFCGANFATVAQSPKNGCTSSQPYSGDLISPSFSLAGADAAQVRFQAWWEIESVDADRFDVMQVSYSTDGGATWVAAGQLNPTTDPNGLPEQSFTANGTEEPAQWLQYRMSLSAAAGQPDVRLKFTFDTRDDLYQGFRGWLLDDVAVDTTTGQVTRPVVFVPGIGGSSLFLDAGSRPVPTRGGGTFDPNLAPGTKLWVNQGILQDAVLHGHVDGTLGQLRFSSDANPQPLVPSVSTHPNELFVDAGGYGDVVPFFQAAGYQLDRTLFLAPYDWRFPVDRNVFAVTAAISRALAANPTADGVDIVAHSMGTMVTRAFLKSADPSFLSEVRHVVLLGGPQLGTPSGSVALIFGSCLGAQNILNTPLQFCPVSPADVQFVFRTLPGGADLAVSPAYYRFMDGHDKDHPVAFTDTRSPDEGGIPGSNYARLRTEETANQTTPAILNAAEAFHADDLQWLANLPSAVHAKISIVAGTGQCTIGQIREVTVPIPEPDGSVLLTRGFDYQQVDGDGTVARQSAALEDPAEGLSATGPATVYYRNLTHAQLAQRGGKGLDLALQLLRDTPGVNPSTPQTGSDDCEVLSVHSPMEVLVTDASGRRTGVSGTTMYEEIPGSSYEAYGDMKVVVLPTSGTYSASFAGTGAGEATVRLRRTQSGVLQQAAVYQHVPVTTTARASLSFDAGQGTSSPLTVDVRGDGSDVRTITANALTGAGAADTDPPTITGVTPADGSTILQGGPSELAPVSVGWSAADPASGLGTSFAVVDEGVPAQRIPLSSPGVVELELGTHTLDVWAVDRAGNAAHTRTSFTVQGGNQASGRLP